MSIAIAEIEGRTAFGSGIDRAGNPYPAERATYDAWLFGWDDGARQVAREIWLTSSPEPKRPFIRRI